MQDLIKQIREARENMDNEDLTNESFEELPIYQPWLLVWQMIY